MTKVNILKPMASFIERCEFSDPSKKATPISGLLKSWYHSSEKIEYYKLNARLGFDGESQNETVETETLLVKAWLHGYEEINHYVVEKGDLVVNVNDTCDIRWVESVDVSDGIITSVLLVNGKCDALYGNDMNDETYQAFDGNLIDFYSSFRLLVKNENILI